MSVDVDNDQQQLNLRQHHITSHHPPHPPHQSFSPRAYPRMDPASITQGGTVLAENLREMLDRRLACADGAGSSVPSEMVLPVVLVAEDMVVDEDGERVREEEDARGDLAPEAEPCCRLSVSMVRVLWVLLLLPRCEGLWG